MRPAMTDTARDTAMPAEVGGQDDDTELMRRLVAEYGGHSVTIVRDGQSLIGWSTGRSVAIADLREIVTSTALATERTAHAEMRRERDEQWRRANVLAQQNAYHKDRAETAEARVAELEKALVALERMDCGVDWCDQDEQARRWAAARRALTGGEF